MMDDRELIERLRGLLANATPGPWYTLDAPWLPSGSETSILAESPDPHVARFICDFDIWALDDDEGRKSENPDDDAALIVAAVNELPGLLDRLQALSAEVLQLRQENAELQEPSPYCDQCGSCGEQGCGCTHKCKYAFEHPDVAAEIETLRAALRRIEGGDDNWQLVATQALKGANNG